MIIVITNLTRCKNKARRKIEHTSSPVVRRRIPHVYGQTCSRQDIEEKILSMYAKGMTTGDIEKHIQDIYGIEVSDTTINRIADKILAVAKEWQQRRLEAVWAGVFLVAIHYHVRSEGKSLRRLST